MARSESVGKVFLFLVFHLFGFAFHSGCQATILGNNCNQGKSNKLRFHLAVPSCFLISNPQNLPKVKVPHCAYDLALNSVLWFLSLCAKPNIACGSQIVNTYFIIDHKTNTAMEQLLAPYFYLYSSFTINVPCDLALPLPLHRSQKGLIAFLTSL